MIVEYKLQLGTQDQVISFAVDDDVVIISISDISIEMKGTISREDFYKIANTMQEDFPLEVDP